MKWKGLKRWKTENIVNHLPQFTTHMKEAIAKQNWCWFDHLRDSTIEFQNELKRRREVA